MINISAAIHANDKDNLFFILCQKLYGKFWKARKATPDSIRPMTITKYAILR